METNKFEEYIKEKLKGREIQPSKTSWESISGRLQTPQKQHSKNYFRYGIAASIAGLLVVSIFLMNQTETPSDLEIVNTPETEKERELKEDLHETRVVDAKQVVVEEGSTSTLKNTDLDSSVFTKQVVANVKEKRSKPDSNGVEDKTLAIEYFEKPMVSDAIVEAKIAELLEKVDVLEQNDHILADAEVDSLLKIAQLEILGDKTIDSSGSLDASALLAEVEDELDQSFRNQIFEKLKTGLLKVRTAVADRNN